MDKILKHYTRLLRPLESGPAHLYTLLSDEIRDRVGNRVWGGISKFQQGLLKARCLTIPGNPEICYWEMGDPEAVPLVFLHGFADSKEGIYLSALRLKKKFRLIVPDLPGFGRSTKNPKIRHNLASYSRWLRDFFQVLQLKQIYLAGNSLGGSIAAQLALDAPELIKGLILIDSAGVVPYHSYSFYDELLEGKNFFRVSTYTDLNTFFSRVFHRPVYIPLLLKLHFFHEHRKNQEWHWRLFLDLMGDENGLPPKEKDYGRTLNPRLRDIKAPTLVIWGEHDSLFPLESAQIIKENVPQSELVIFKDVGHCPQLEVPREFCQTVIEFVSKLEGSYKLGVLPPSTGKATPET